MDRASTLPKPLRGAGLPPPPLLLLPPPVVLPLPVELPPLLLLSR